MGAAGVAMQDALKVEFLYLSLGTFVIILSSIWIFSPKANKRKQRGAICSCIITLVLFAFWIPNSTIPLLKDCFSENIVVAQGVYKCTAHDREGSSLRAILGVTSVVLQTDENEIKLTTAPFREDLFTNGECEVTAYYLPSAKVLLHIEIAQIEIGCR